MPGRSRQLLHRRVSRKHPGHAGTGWANGTIANNGVEIRADNEASTAAYKRFTSTDAGTNAPTLTVTYDAAPDVPANLTPGWATTDYPIVNTLTPTLSASFCDQYGAIGSVNFALEQTSGTPISTTQAGAAAACGGTVTLTVPTGALADDTTYRWRASATTDAGTSAWSPYEYFTVHTSWGTFTPSGDLTPTSYQLVTGTPDADGGCDTSLENTMFPDGVDGADQVAVSPNRCEVEYLLGVSTADATVPTGTDYVLDDGDVPVDPHVAVTVSQKKAFYLQVWYEDPAGIKVTGMREDLEWGTGPNGGALLIAKKFHAWHYDPSGWIYSDGDGPATGVGASGHAYIQARRSYYNFAFPLCVPPDEAHTSFGSSSSGLDYVRGGPGTYFAWKFVDRRWTTIRGTNTTISGCSNYLHHKYRAHSETPWQ